MKCEFKQVCRGISHTVQSAAYAAEVSGKLTAQAVASVDALDEELLAACASSSEEEELFRLFAQSEKFGDQKAVAKMAIKSILAKWRAED